MTYYDGHHPWSGNSDPTEADIARSNLQNLAESLRSEVRDLTARNAALVAALHEVYPWVPRADAAKVITDALAAEERAATVTKKPEASPLPFNPDALGSAMEDDMEAETPSEERAAKAAKEGGK
jgi:hypothetical protein